MKSLGNGPPGLDKELDGGMTGTEGVLVIFKDNLFRHTFNDCGSCRAFDFEYYMITKQKLEKQDKTTGIKTPLLPHKTHQRRLLDQLQDGLEAAFAVEDITAAELDGVALLVHQHIKLIKPGESNSLAAKALRVHETAVSQVGRNVL